MTNFPLFASWRKALMFLVALGTTMELTRCAPSTVIPSSTEPSQGEQILIFAFENRASAPSDNEPGSLNEWAWSRDGRYFYGAFSNGLVRRINLEQGHTDGAIILDPYVSHLALSPD